MPICAFIKSPTSTSTPRRPICRGARAARLPFELLEGRRFPSFTQLVGIPSGSPFTPGVLLGHGDETFQSPPLVGDVGFSGTESSRVAVFDHDGPLDLLSGVGVVAVMKGNGDGTFSPSESASLGSAIGGIRTVTVVDVNADGKPNVVGAVYSAVLASAGDHNTTRSAGVMLGDGNGCSGPPIISNFGTVNTHVSVRAAVSADFNDRRGQHRHAHLPPRREDKDHHDLGRGDSRRRTSTSTWSRPTTAATRCSPGTAAPARS